MWRAHSPAHAPQNPFRFEFDAGGVLPLATRLRLRHLENMPVPLEFLRGMLVVMALFFAYMAGRSLVGVQRRRVQKSKLYAWLIRLVVCAGAAAYRHPFDLLDAALCLLAALALAAGYWDEKRPRTEEDLSREMFRQD